MKRTIAFLCGVGLMLPLPAAADWQFTKWGMTPAQVKAASKGAAKELLPDEAADSSPKDGHVKALLGSDYVSGNFTFRAYFRFDAEQKLREVMLSNTSNGSDILDALKEKYGPPITDKSTQGVIRQTEWLTAQDHIFAFWVIDSKTLAPQGGTVSVTYSARLNKANSGL